MYISYDNSRRNETIIKSSYTSSVSYVTLRNFCQSLSITWDQIKKLTSFPEVVRRSVGRNAPFLISGEIRGSSRWGERRNVRVNASRVGTRRGWVVNFLSATPVTSAKVTGPFITGANRSPVSRREAVLQVFRQHRNTSDRYSRPHRPATNGRRRLPRRPCRWDARATTSDGGTDDTPIQESFPTW